MRRAAFCMMVTLSGAAAFGQQGLLDCIEPDVLRGLVLQGQGEPPPVITAAMPRELSAVKMPAQFTWIGSAERALGRMDASTTASQVTAAWRSSLPYEAARTAAAAALAASGWELRTSGMATYVFRSASLQVTQSACRDGQEVGVTSTSMEGVTYVLLRLQRDNFGSSCSQPMRPGVITGLEPYLPRLEMPIDPATGQAARMHGSSQGSRSGMVDARAELTIRDSAGNAARHFAKQLTEQGWSSDAAWSGTTTAGSSWSRREGGELIHGMLSVITVSDGNLRAELRITRLP